jgi:TRAP-type C4-dicarboxylate transport system permease small subunit
MATERMAIVARARHVLDRVLERFVVLLVMLLAVVVIAGVLFRKFGAPLVWYDEVASIMLAWLTYYGACLAALRRAHLGFPLLVDAASPQVRRVMIIVREAVVVAFFGVAAWTGWMVVVALDGFYLASLPWVSKQVTQSVIPIGAVIFIVAELLGAADEPAPIGAPAPPEPMAAAAGTTVLR